jgi:hypothetical protein
MLDAVHIHRNGNVGGLVAWAPSLILTTKE